MVTRAEFEQQLKKAEQSFGNNFIDLAERGFWGFPLVLQNLLSKMSVEDAHASLMHVICDWRRPLNICDEYMSPALCQLEEGLRQSLNNLQLRDQTLQHAPKRFYLLEERCNTLYVREDCPNGGERFFRVSGLRRLEGPRFYADLQWSDFWSPQTVDIKRIAPPNANAYLAGSAWEMKVEDGKAISPISGRPLAITNSFVHEVIYEMDCHEAYDARYVVPIQFFNTTIDRSTPYHSLWSQEKRVCELVPIERSSRQRKCG